MEENRKELLKKFYKNNDFLGYYTDDSENIIRIDLEEEIVYYNVSFTGRCGCCMEIEERENNLDDFLKYMSDSDFEELIEELKNSSTENKS